MGTQSTVHCGVGFQKVSFPGQNSYILKNCCDVQCVYSPSPVCRVGYCSVV